MKEMSSAYSRETRATSGASPWQMLHHGAQNQIATSRPANEAPSTVPPPSCGAEKSSTWGTLGSRPAPASGVPWAAFDDGWAAGPAGGCDGDDEHAAATNPIATTSTAGRSGLRLTTPRTHPRPWRFHCEAARSGRPHVTAARRARPTFSLIRTRSAARAHRPSRGRPPASDRPRRRGSS